VSNAAQPDDLRGPIWQAARDQDWDALFDTAFRLDWGHDGHIPQSTFRLLLDALGDHEFVASTASNAILEAFEQFGIVLGTALSGFSQAQHDDLLSAMELAFPNAAPQTRFMIGVILGEHLKDRGALDVLRRLRAVEDSEARKTVAHALQHLAWESKDHPLRAAAVAALSEMLDDPDPLVRDVVTAYVVPLRKSFN
jgi:hypothetical protein